VEVLCPSCGATNWLENQSRCLQCNAILRRCKDCSNYDGRKQVCRATQDEVDSYEAEHPSVLSTSTNCLSYRYAAGSG
jgi:hypothetical protein